MAYQVTGSYIPYSCIQGIFILKRWTNKCTGVKFTLEQTMKAQRGGRGIALHFLHLGTRWGGWSTPRPGRFTPGKDPVPIVQEAGWAPGPVWKDGENHTPTGTRSPDRPAHSESLYWLSYPGPLVKYARKYIIDHVQVSVAFAINISVLILTYTIWQSVNILSIFLYSTYISVNKWKVYRMWNWSLYWCDSPNVVVSTLQI